MKVLRTPQERFAGLPDFGYEPRYADVGGLRLAYVEAGPRAGEPVLLLHGEPSWSFLYRKVIPVLAEDGLRVIGVPVRGYRGEITLTPAPGGTRISWSASWDKTLRGRLVWRGLRDFLPAALASLTTAAAS